MKDHYREIKTAEYLDTFSYLRTDDYLQEVLGNSDYTTVYYKEEAMNGTIATILDFLGCSRAIEGA